MPLKSTPDQLPEMTPRVVKPKASVSTGAIASIVLSGIFPALVILVTPFPVYSSWIGTMVVIMMAGFRFSWILGSRDRHLFEMTTWLFVYIFLGLAPLVQLRLGIDPSTTPNLFHGYDWYGISIVMVGCLSIMIGSFYAARSPTPRSSNTSTFELSPMRVRTLGVISLVLGTYYILRIGPSTFLGNRDGLALMRATVWPDSTTNAIIHGGITMTLLVSAVAQIILWRSRKYQGERRPIVMLVATISSLFFCVNFLSSPRYVFGSVLLGILAAVGIYRTVRSFRAIAAGAILGMLFLFPLLDLFRRTTTQKFSIANPLDSLISGDFDSLAQISNTAVYVERFGVTWGNQLLGVVFFWVPRSIWPGKALDTGVLVANSRDYGFTNLSAPLWSELFINGGWAVLVVGMFLFGFALRRWDSIVEVALRTSNVLPVLGCIAPFYMLIILRGSLLQSVASISVVLLASWFVRGQAKLGEGKLAVSTPRRQEASGN